MNSNKIRLGLSNPKLIARKASQFYNQIRTSSNYNPNGINIMNESWDNLIILDACRYDLFKQENNLSGTLRCVESRGSATPEFLRGNFDGGQFLDTVYVTANPMLHRHRDELNVDIYEVIDLWRGDTWNDAHETVLPGTVAREAKQAAAEFPNKRLIVHYMQPHYPFIEADLDFDKGHIGENEPDKLTTWMKILTNEVSVDVNDLWQAYADNLRSALPHVAELVNALHGKTVVTSDHGNMFGERSSHIPIREWGHPPGVWTDELVKVPWLEVEYDERRQIISEETNESSPEDDATVQERLESLGYV